MFKKLKKQVEGLDSPNKDESPQATRRRSSLQASGRNRSSQRLGLPTSDSNASISEADVLSGKVSHDDLLSAFMQRTNQLKKLEIKLSDYSQALKESNKDRDKLANILEKQQDTAMKRMSELEETYSEGKLSMEKTIARLEKKETDFAETIELLRTENKKLRASVDKFAKEKNEFEKKRDEFYEKRDDTEELNDLQMQELAKVKHMLIMREKECEKYRNDLDQKVAELLQSQDGNEQMEASLRETTDSLNANVKELEAQILANEEKSASLNECKATISQLQSEITVLKSDLCSVNAELKNTNAKVSSLESLNAQLSEKYEGLKHSSGVLLSKTNVELDEKHATIDHLQQKISLLENRVTTDKLPESEQVQALIQERTSLETRLEESYVQLNNIKSTWSVKINQLEQQISHLNKKIVEDQEELVARDVKISESESSKSKEIDKLNATINNLENDLEKNEVTIQNYIQQITELEADLIERSTLYDLEKEKASSVHEKELRTSYLIHEELKSQVKSLSESLQRGMEEKDKLSTEVTRLQSELTQLKQGFESLQESNVELQSMNESLEQERDSLNQKCLECDSKLNIFEGKLSLAEKEIDELNKKAANLAEINDDTSAQLQANVDQLESKDEELQNFRNSMASNKTLAEEFEGKISTLESTILSREKELIDCKTEIATLKNSQAEENEEVASLKAERNKADELLAERDRLIKVQQQRLSDLKKALNKELNKKSSLGRAENQRTASPKRELEVNGFGSHYASNSGEFLPDIATINTTSIDDPSLEPKEINVKYLKHVLLTFLGGSRSEALQLVKALSTLLSFNRDEEKFVKETLEYKNSWFGSKPSSKKVVAHTSRK